jgi:hypothetical protein
MELKRSVHKRMPVVPTLSQIYLDKKLKPYILKKCLILSSHLYLGPTEVFRLNFLPPPKWKKPDSGPGRVKIVTWWLKARIMEKLDAAIARERRSKHTSISTATNQRATIRKLFQTLFSTRSVLRSVFAIFIKFYLILYV